MSRHFQLVAMFLLVLALGLAACGGPPPPAEEAPPAEEEAVAPAEGEEAPAEPAEAPTSAPTSPPAEPTDELAEIPSLAFDGVTRNADWQPIIQDFDGVAMALVPAGCFMMGSTDEQINYAVELYGSGAERSWFEEEQPVHEVCFEEPFWIDAYEVTNGQFGSAASHCTDWSSGDDQPRICVDCSEAATYCDSRGARLPTEAEWEYSARGPDGLVYPWGNEFAPDNVVYVGSSGGETASVGSSPGGVSWVGAYDLSGNVLEWLADWYGIYPSGAQVNPSGPDSGEFRVMRGGSWDSDAYDLRGADRSGFYPFGSGSINGFRCARDY